MQSTREWLEPSGLITKNSTLEINKLGPINCIANKALYLLKKCQDELPESSEIISVAVDDMKVVTALTKLIVAYGVYTEVPHDQLLNYTSRFRDFPTNNESGQGFVELDRTLFKEILFKNDDISKLILISPFLVDILAYLAYYQKPNREHDGFKRLADALPTGKLYAALIQLRVVKNPQRVVVDYTTNMPILRKDAVKSLLELSSESSNVTLDTVSIILSSVNVRGKVYIESLGLQFYDLLALQNKLSSLTAELVVLVSQRVPQLVGGLRNLIVKPLTAADTTTDTTTGTDAGAGTYSGKSLSCLLELVKNSNSKHSKLVDHLISKCSLSLWLLVWKTKCQSSFVSLLAKSIEVKPTVVVDISQQLMSDCLPGGLEWITDDQKEPKLVTVVKPPKDEILKLESIDERVESFCLVLETIDDDLATTSLLLLLQSYLGTSTNDVTESNPMSILAQAKVIERVITHSKLKTKLFGNLKQVIDFGFSMLEAKLQHIHHHIHPSHVTAQLQKLEVKDSDADSDDEDQIEQETNEADLNEGEYNLVDLILQLLTGAVMECLGKEDHNIEDLVTESQKQILENLTKPKNPKLVLPQQIVERANFCLQMITGSVFQTPSSSKTGDTLEDKLNEAKHALLEPLVPSQAYGLYLYGKLLEQKAVNVRDAMKVFVSMLSAEDSYVYLNAIKGIETASRTNNTNEVIDLLLPEVSSAHATGSTTGNATTNIDTCLRAREALMKILTPGSIQKINNSLVNSLLGDLKAEARDTVDLRLRLSSSSILGIIVSQFPESIANTQQSDLLDCTIGILRFEKDTHLHRSIVILALEIMNAVNEGHFKNLNLESLKLQIIDTMESTNDETLIDHCKAVIASI